MSELSGYPKLDEAIAAFLAADEFNPDHPEQQGNGYSLELLRDPAEAFSCCTDASLQFTDFALARGLESFLPWQEQAQALGELNGRWYPAHQQRINELGHTLSYVDVDGALFTVDWTAAQFFGADCPFPLLQRLAADGEQWQPLELSPQLPG